MLDRFMQKHMKKGSRFVPARLQAALALLEKLRDSPSLVLGDHLASKGSSGLESHETFGDRAHKRLGIEAINKNHGRRSSSLQDWGQDLLDIMEKEGFGDASSDARARLIEDAQEPFAAMLRDILKQEPLEVQIGGRSPEAVISDLLRQAQNKGKTGEVAQYLVGAKLMLKFKGAIPVQSANKADRKSRSDRKAKLGDFVIENDIIEIAVGLPDDKHISQIAEAIEPFDTEVRLITLDERLPAWKRELEKRFNPIEMERVVLSSVDAFVGQNISELAVFSAKAKSEQLRALFDLYNTCWIDKVGTPGIRIVAK